MLRRTELVSLQVPDLLEEVRGQRQPSGAPLQDRRRGQGRDRLGRAGQPCGWSGHGSTAAGSRSGSAVSRSVGKGGRPGERAESPAHVSRIFKAMARDGLPAGGGGGRACPGHSARVGAAQDMVAAGIELPAILQAGPVEIPGDGEPLRRAAAREAQRRCAAGPDAGAGLNGAGDVARKTGLTGYGIPNRHGRRISG